MSKEPEPPGERYWSLVEPIWDSINIHDGPDEFVRQFRAAPIISVYLFAGHWCQSEVCNGGFDQFFRNSTGVLAPEAMLAYRAMGLVEWADVVADAMAFLGEPYPRERAARQARLSADATHGRRHQFEHLDKRFYEWLHAEPYRWERAADRYAVRSMRDS